MRQPNFTSQQKAYGRLSGSAAQRYLNRHPRFAQSLLSSGAGSSIAAATSDTAAAAYAAAPDNTAGPTYLTPGNSTTPASADGSIGDPGAYSNPTPDVATSPAKKSSGGLPTWAWIAIGVGGVALLFVYSKYRAVTAPLRHARRIAAALNG